MEKPKTIKFERQLYFDDRLFILYICKGTVEIEPGDDGSVWTRIYHEKAPENYLWCVATYRNCNRYPLYRVDSFFRKEDAILYVKQIEPETPLISLNGKSPLHPVSYEEYLLWKKKNSLNEYDWKSLYSADGRKARETIGQEKKQFKGIK